MALKAFVWDFDWRGAVVVVAATEEDARRTLEQQGKSSWIAYEQWPSREEPLKVYDIAEGLVFVTEGEQ